EAPTDELVLAVRRAGVLSEPTIIHFGSKRWFGPNKEVPVLLVLPGRVSTLHQCLADELEQLPGFTADEPGFWRVGYRPQLTFGSATPLETGEAKGIGQIAIAQLSGESDDCRRLGPSGSRLCKWPVRRRGACAWPPMEPLTPRRSMISRAGRDTAGDTSSRG